MLLQEQGGLPGLIMRMKSDGHRELQILGPKGETYNVLRLCLKKLASPCSGNTTVWGSQKQHNDGMCFHSSHIPNYTHPTFLAGVSDAVAAMSHFVRWQHPQVLVKDLDSFSHFAYEVKRLFLLHDSSPIELSL